MFSDLWRHRFLLVTEISMPEYENGRSFSSKDVLPAIAMPSIDEHFSLFAVWTIFHHIYFCHEKTRITSDRDIGKHDFVRFYSTSPYANECKGSGQPRSQGVFGAVEKKKKTKKKQNKSIINYLLSMLNYFPSIDWVGLAKAFVELI